MTSHKKAKLIAWSAGTLAAIAVAACGGGDDSRSRTALDPTVSVPAGASASVDGFIGYLQQLVQVAADGAEPVDTQAVVPPTDDKVEPASVN